MLDMKMFGMPLAATVSKVIDNFYGSLDEAKCTKQDSRVVSIFMRDALQR